ncbi:F-Box Only Protein 8 [Manis pentadactyla]|nr:F-Box Only Protein 8 [Manis pentadactyla]
MPLAVTNPQIEPWNVNSSQGLLSDHTNVGPRAPCIQQGILIRDAINQEVFSNQETEWPPYSSYYLNAVDLVPGTCVCTKCIFTPRSEGPAPTAVCHYTLTFPCW